MKKKKAMKWINNIVTVILFALVIGIATMVAMTKLSGGEPEVFGYQLKTVLSGSMEPDIQTGSVIAVKPGGDMTRFAEDDVITFKAEENKLITHRITEVIQNEEQVMYRTKGDNNKTEDPHPVLSDNVVAEYTGFTVPYLGYFVNFSQSRNGAFLLLIPGIILLMYSGFMIYKGISQIDTRQSNKREQTAENEHMSS